MIQIDLYRDDVGVLIAECRGEAGDTCRTHLFGLEEMARFLLMLEQTRDQLMDYVEEAE